MAWYNEDNPDTLNFIIAGNHHSGYELLQESLTAHPEIICHGDILHHDTDVRRAEHEDYFGPSGKVPDWYVPNQLSAEQYLNNKVFDNVLCQERAVGVKVGYEILAKNDLWEYADQKCRQGCFCLLHVTRNPVACFVAKQQVDVQVGPLGTKGMAFPDRKVKVNPRDLTEFVRDHLATELKVDRLCRDRAIIPYHELVMDFRGVLEQLSEFLEIRFSPACVPNQKAIVVRDMRNYISNWVQLRAELPPDVMEQLDSPTLF